MPPTPSPATTGVVKLKDTGIATYVEFPDDTFFMESFAQNSNYKPGVAFVPAQRLVNGKEETHIYTMTAKSTKAEHFMGPITVDGSTKISVFGSALSSDGILWLCAFNRNSIIGVKCDDKNPASFIEIPDLPSPNDVCLDPDDESILYVVGGTFRSICCCFQFSNSAYGKCFKVQLNKDKTAVASVSIQAEGMRTLAGVEKIGNILWLAELYQMRYQALDDAASSGKTTINWKGNDSQDMVWMADNIDTFGPSGEWMLCPAYSTVPASTVENVMSRAFLVSLALFYFQISTACMKGESFAEAIKDPEVSLSFSNTYIQEGVDPAPVRLIFMKNSDFQQCYHFEVDLEESRLANPPRDIKDIYTGEIKGKRHYFNEQVTHAGHLVDPETGEGFVACVNFEQPRILLLKDTPFISHIDGEA